jgi:hypothetical protein
VAPRLELLADEGLVLIAAVLAGLSIEVQTHDRIWSGLERSKPIELFRKGHTPPHAFHRQLVASGNTGASAVPALRFVRQEDGGID